MTVTGTIILELHSNMCDYVPVLINLESCDCLQVIAYQKTIASAQQSSAQQEITGLDALYSETAYKSKDQEINIMYVAT